MAIKLKEIEKELIGNIYTGHDMKKTIQVVRDLVKALEDEWQKMHSVRCGMGCCNGNRTSCSYPRPRELDLVEDFKE